MSRLASVQESKERPVRPHQLSQRLRGLTYHLAKIRKMREASDLFAQMGIEHNSSGSGGVYEITDQIRADVERELKEIAEDVQRQGIDRF